ncbi:RNA degradosome polyphosphate kinase [Facklamia hominis]
MSLKPLIPSNNSTPSIPDPDFNDPSLYFNRELSWLDFNQRCILNAYDHLNPFLEQLNFIAIASSNLDEFYMVRVAGVYDQLLADVAISENKTYQTPDELLDHITAQNQKNLQLQYQRYHELIQELPQTGYQIKQMKDLTDQEVDQVQAYFDQLILPTLSPLAIDAYRPFPHLINKAINIYIELKEGKQRKQAILPIPQLLDRYYLLEGETNTLILIEDIIIYFLDSLFKGYQINQAFPFRITRNADFDLAEEEADDLLAVIEDYVQKRKNGMAVRIEIDQRYFNGSPSLPDSFFTTHFELDSRLIDQIEGPLDLTYLFSLRQLIGQTNPQFLFKPYQPYLNPKLLGEKLFDAARQSDLYFHHPYDDFKPIIELVSHAATDPQTISIKQTLYRVSKHSPIIQALKLAAQNGKEVTVLVELKARFDEENNVYWAKELEEAGCHVLYGVSELKTHSKICLVIRKEGDHIQPYLHLGTGNYNDKTAKLYTDMGLITTHPGLCQDAIEFFNYLSGYCQRPEYRYLHVSPFEIRDSLMDAIDEEISYQEEFGNGHIIAKMNSLTDKSLIQKLYQASQAGVKIDLIVRGICCLRPGIKGISETIHVRSIVGRLLEHSRIYYFHRNGQQRLFLSSADMMTRNMVKRVEIEFPILDKKIEDKILNFLNLQLSDNQHAFILDSAGKYHLTRPNNEPAVNSQEILIQDAVDRQKKLHSQQDQGKTRLVSRTKRNSRLLGNLWQILKAWYPFK